MEGGDREALARRLVETYSDQLLRVAYSLLNSVPDAQDVCQEALLKALDHSGQFESQEHERAWLIRATANRCKSWGRSFWRKRTVPLELNQATAPPPPEHPDVLAAVAHLPAKYRWPVYLHYIEGYTAAEIGQLLGCPRNTVLSRLSRAREKLKAALKEEWT